MVVGFLHGLILLLAFPGAGWFCLTGGYAIFFHGNRDGSRESFERYQSEKAPVTALAEMYTQGCVHTESEGDHRGDKQS